MELVGHDFFLFVDARSDHPSVVYRRKGCEAFLPQRGQSWLSIAMHLAPEIMKQSGEEHEVDLACKRARVEGGDVSFGRGSSKLENALKVVRECLVEAKLALTAKGFEAALPLFRRGQRSRVAEGAQAGPDRPSADSCHQSHT